MSRPRALLLLAALLAALLAPAEAADVRPSPNTNTLASPTITGTVAGGASYTSPTITGTVAGGASYTSPTITGTTSGSTVALGSGSGTGTLCAIPTGGVITTAVGNIGGGEDDLMSFSLPANSLSRDGSSVEIEGWFSAAANGNLKTIEPYFGATKAGWGGDNWNTNTVWIRVLVVRTSATSQMMFGFLTIVSGTSRAYVTPTETLSGAVTIKFTGLSGGSATDDIIQRLMRVTVCN